MYNIRNRLTFFKSKLFSNQTDNKMGLNLLNITVSVSLF